jgi:hypothetical protein
MSMSFWVIVSWVFVFILTAINVAVFWKLKQASEQMMKMAFPNAKNMNEALASMQGMMGNMGAMGGMGGAMGGGMPGRSNAGKSFGMPANRGAAPAAGGKQSADAQLKAAMEMLNKMQKR